MASLQLSSVSFFLNTICHWHNVLHSLSQVWCIQVSIFVILEVRLLMFTPCLYRKAVKATLVLLPLLGITYMLFFVNPGEDDISQIVFIYFNSFLQSFQVRIWSTLQCNSWQHLKTPTQSSMKRSFQAIKAFYRRDLFRLDDITLSLSLSRFWALLWEDNLR